jgi:hypothetical protein
MDCAIRPEQFSTDEEWTAYKRQYQKRYNQKHKERKRLLALGAAEKSRRTHVKKRRN